MSSASSRAVIGLTAAVGVAAAGRRAGGLTPAGAIAATAVGAAVVWGGGYRAGTALVGFFVSSSLLGRMPRRTSAPEQRRGDRRDAVQVLANGGVPAVLALACLIAPDPARTRLIIGLSAAIATAAADTWATEIGSRFGGRPRSIATLRPVIPGASGGVSGAGFVASAAGATFVAATTATDGTDARLTAFAGVVGAVVDSVLGATVQEVRFCPSCQRETELLVHRCGSLTDHLRGTPWCNNDTVNVLAIATGALAAMALHSLRSSQTRVSRCSMLAHGGDPVRSSPRGECGLRVKLGSDLTSAGETRLSPR